MRVFLSERADGVCFFFFFQAEDGIRDLTVTGVQTCALPICRRRPKPVPDVDGVAGFKSERWPLSNRNGGRLQIGMVADITSEKAAALRRNPQILGFSLRSTNVRNSFEFFDP